MVSATETSQEIKTSQRFQERNCEDRISALSDDLLVNILLFVPTKDIVTTMILSKRWRTIWTAVPRLEYEDRKGNTNNEQKSVWWSFEKSLQLHKAPILESLCVRLGERCPTNADVAKLIAQAVDRCMRRLVFDLRWSAKPTSMPNSLYTSETLIELKLFHKIFLDIPPSVCLPSVAKLSLCCVVYKDEVSFIRLLSGCPVLRILHVIRCEEDDNVKNYSVKVPSLENFSYLNERPLSQVNDVADITRSLVLDCPALTKLYIDDYSGDSCSIGNMPVIIRAFISTFCYPDKKLMRNISSATSISLTLTNGLIMCRPDNYFSQLVNLSIVPYDSGWLEQLMLMLKTSPKLKSLTISSNFSNIPLLWNKPDHVPECLATHLEFFQWLSYEGKQAERELVAYILGNSECLKEADFPLMNCNLYEEKKIREELNSMFKISPSCRLAK